jgi:hypothetical protein
MTEGSPKKEKQEKEKEKENRKRDDASLAALQQDMSEEKKKEKLWGKR